MTGAPGDTSNEFRRDTFLNGTTFDELGFPVEASIPDQEGGLALPQVDRHGACIENRKDQSAAEARINMETRDVDETAPFDLRLHRNEHNGVVGHGDDLL